MAKILCTGGAGFIGSNLCERLANLGHDVTSLDNYYTGSYDNHVDGVTYIEGDTRYIDELIDFKPDLIYHLGEYSRVEQSLQDLETVWDYNVNGTFAVLQFVRRTGSKLVYAGSSTKFADKTDYIQSPYAWSKAKNTELVINYGDWFGINYAITYFYNVYGKREISEGNYATLIAKYKSLMKQDKPLPVVRPGIQERNFTHIDDIIDALVLIGNDGIGDEFGIGNHQSFSILEVAELFGGEISYLEPRLGNRMSAPVLTHKTRLLGWKPKRDLFTYIENLKHNGWAE